MNVVSGGQLHGFGTHRVTVSFSFSENKHISMIKKSTICYWYDTIFFTLLSNTICLCGCGAHTDCQSNVSIYDQYSPHAFQLTFLYEKLSKQIHILFIIDEVWCPFYTSHSYICLIAINHKKIYAHLHTQHLWARYLLLEVKSSLIKQCNRVWRSWGLDFFFVYANEKQYQTTQRNVFQVGNRIFFYFLQSFAICKKKIFMMIHSLFYWAVYFRTSTKELSQKTHKFFFFIWIECKHHA